MQLKQSLEEKATILTTLDEKILEKTPDEEVEKEIQHLDIFADSTYYHKIGKGIERN